MSKFQIVLFFFFCTTFIASANQPKINQDRFSGEYNPDAVYEYRTYQVTVLNRGEEPRQEVHVDKNRKTIYYDNNLGNAFLTFIFTLIYFILIGYIVYRRKTYLFKIVVFASLFTAILIPLSFYTLFYNIKELYIRSLGIEIEGEVAYYTDSRIVERTTGRGGSRREREFSTVFYFWYIPKDSIKRQFSGEYTQLKVEDLNSYLEDGRTDVTICLSKNGEEATIQLPRLQKENVSNIFIYTLILIIMLLFYIGVFDKQLKKLSDKMDFNYKRKKS